MTRAHGAVQCSGGWDQLCSVSCLQGPGEGVCWRNGRSKSLDTRASRTTYSCARVQAALAATQRPFIPALHRLRSGHATHTHSHSRATCMWPAGGTCGPTTWVASGWGTTARTRPGGPPLSRCGRTPRAGAWACLFVTVHLCMATSSCRVACWARVRIWLVRGVGRPEGHGGASHCYSYTTAMPFHLATLRAPSSSVAQGP